MDLSKLTKADLIALVEQQAAAQAAVQVSPAPQSQTGISVEALVSAIIASREAHSPPPVDNTLHKVESVIGMQLAFEVADMQTGLARQHVLSKRGDYVMLTTTQIERFKEQYPLFFEKGYLACPTVVEYGPNTIPDVAAFVEALTDSKINSRIAEITSEHVLFTLYDYVETQRWTHLDAKGNLLTEQLDDLRSIPTIAEVEVSPKLLAVSRAAARRYFELTGVRLTLDS